NLRRSIHFFFSSRRRHTRSYGDWSSDVCSSDLYRDNLGDVLQRRRKKADVVLPLGVGTVEEKSATHHPHEGSVGGESEGSGRLQIGRASCRERVWGPVGGRSLEREHAIVGDRGR